MMYLICIIMKYSNYKNSDEFALWWDQEIIHPYLGFLIDFNDEKKNKETYGFTTTVNPVIKREPGKLNVVLLGGSVAGSMGPILQRGLPPGLPGAPQRSHLGGRRV